VEGNDRDLYYLKALSLEELGKNHKNFRKNNLSLGRQSKLGSPRHEAECWPLNRDVLSMGQLTKWSSPPSEANSCSTDQEVPRLLYKLKVHYRVHKSPPPVFVLTQMNPVQNLPPYFFKVHFNIVLPSSPKSFKWSLPFRFSD
jgi:hypothetical protein